MLIFGTCCILYYVTHSFYSFLFILCLHFGGVANANKVANASQRTTECLEWEELLR